MSIKNNDAKDSVKRSPSTVIALGKDLMALLRDLAVFVLALLLLVFPSQLNSVLTNAGFEEGSLAGFKWKSTLVQSDAALKEARATIADLKAQLEKTSQAIAETDAKLNDPALKTRLAKLQDENKQLNAVTSKVEASVASTISANAPLVERAQGATASNGQWGVIFGGDATLDAAKYEVDVAAKKLGLPRPSIYLRQGSYRSVSLAESRSEAEQVLSKAKQRRADAYVVNMSTWCPVTTERDGYRECALR